MHRLRLRPDTVGPVGRGHPWVYRDGLIDPPLAPGEPVLLLDTRGKPVAFGLCDEGDIAVRVLGRQPDRIPDLLARRVAAAAAAREGVLPPRTDAYRLVNGEGDDLPGLVVDRYGPVAVARLYARAWERWLEPIAAAVAQIPGIESVLRRLGVRRVDAREGAESLHGPPAPESLVVQEAGLRFLVRPYVGQKTGLFLDQREHRRLVGGIAAGREVVNLFAYTGGFSVHAAAGGARRVVTVDIAPDAIADAKENFRLNGLDPAKHGFVVADAFRWQPDAPPGLLICDPPSLSHGRDADAAAYKAYRDLAALCAKSLEVGGLLASASCTARLATQRWEQAVAEGLRAGRWSWLWRSAEPPDHPVSAAHPEGRYLKFALLRRLR